MTHAAGTRIRFSAENTRNAGHLVGCRQFAGRVTRRVALVVVGYVVLEREIENKIDAHFISATKAKSLLRRRINRPPAFH